MTPLRIHLIAVVLIGFAVGLQTVRFAPLSYRQDEAWSVHTGIDRNPAEIVRQMVLDVNPPLYRVILDQWANIVGQHEIPVRYLSALINVLTLALLFRLARDLLGAEVGLWSIFLVGTLPIFIFYGGEARTTPLLFLTATATSLFLLRWLQKGTFQYALLYVTAGITGVYSHFFMVHVVMAQAIFVVLFVRWHFGRYVRAFALFGSVALALIGGWGLVLLHTALVTFPGGIDYGLAAKWFVFGMLHEQFQVVPYGIGQLMLLAALFTPVMQISKHNAVFRSGWQRGYLVILPLAILGLSFGATEIIRTSSAKNLSVIVLPLAILAAYGVHHFPRRLQIIAALLILVPALTQFRLYVSGHFYRDAVAYIDQKRQPDAGYLIDDRLTVAHVPVIYYLRERMGDRLPNDALFHLIELDFGIGGLGWMPHAPVLVADDNSESSLKGFRNYLGDRDQVWYIPLDVPANFGGSFMDILDENYVVHSQESFGDGRMIAVEYRRMPDELDTLYRFDDSLRLVAWRLVGDVQINACESVTVESWWITDAPMTSNYSLSLTMIDSNGERIAAIDSGLSPILTQQWEIGQVVLDERQLDIPCDLLAGEYPIGLGVYDSANGEGLAVTTANGEPSSSFIYLTTLFAN